MSSRSLLLALIVAAGFVTGCETGTLPDPNDPTDVGVLEPEVLRSNLRGVSDSLLERYLKREITKEQYDALMAQYANELLTQAKVEAVAPSRAWEYAEVFRTAKRWREAQSLLKLAVKNAKTEDRRVNDNLRLAHTQAELGEVDEAIATARSVFDARPEDKAPILPATLLEIVPAGRNKGYDFELAELLEDAVDQAMQTVVDPKSEAGIAFLTARPHHTHNAFALAVELYESSGRSDRAQKAMEHEAKIAANSGTT